MIVREIVVFGYFFVLLPIIAFLWWHSVWRKP